MAVALMVRSLHRASNTGSLTSTCLKIRPWYFCCGCALWVPQWVYSVYHRGSNWLVLDPNPTEYAIGKATVLLCCGEGSPAPSLQTGWSEGVHFGRMQTFRCSLFASFGRWSIFSLWDSCRSAAVVVFVRSILVADRQHQPPPQSTVKKMSFALCPAVDFRNDVLFPAWNACILYTASISYVT